MCADAPDTSGTNAAALKSAELSDKAFDWYTKEYDKTQPQRDAAVAQSTAVSDAQLTAMQTATQQAKDYDTRTKTVFQPLEDKIVADAQAYDTPERRLQAANEAQANVETSFGTAQDGLNRSLARSGVTPGSGRSISMMQDVALKKATAIAGATTTAQKGVETQGYARMQDAAALGKGLVGSQATQQQIAQSGGAQAVAASGAGLAATNSGVAMMGQGFGTALQGQQQAGSLYGQAATAGAGANSQNGATAGALGTVAGAALVFF